MTCTFVILQYIPDLKNISTKYGSYEKKTIQIIAGSIASCNDNRRIAHKMI